MSAVVRLGQEDPLHQDVLIRLSSSSSSSLTVCAPAEWLSRVPYFATQLAKPWIASCPQHQIALECTPGSSPEAYLQCLRLLTSSLASWPSLLESVSEVLQILPVADHLLFQDCWDACMGALASFPWSSDEEDAIRATISKLNMEPSPDVKERLDTSQDAAAFKALLDKMLGTSSLEASFVTFCKKCLNHPSATFAAAFHRILLKMSESLSTLRPLPREWYVLAKFLLQFTDAQRFILSVVNSEDVLRIVASSRENDAWRIFNDILEKVERRVVLLSNLERSKLLKWSNHGSVGLSVKEGSPQYYMRLRLAETLPFNDTTRMDVMKLNHQVVPGWIDQVSHRFSEMNETGLKAICDIFDL